MIEVTRRYGGHGGHSTEWEFSTRCTLTAERVRRLAKLNHPLLVAFHSYLEGGGSDGFCVLREDEHPRAARLVPLLFDYLTMWPDPAREAAALCVIASGTTSELPPKVAAWVEVEVWLKSKAADYDVKGLPSGLDVIANAMRQLLNGLATEAAEKARESFNNGGEA